MSWLYKGLDEPSLTNKNLGNNDLVSQLWLAAPQVSISYFNSPTKAPDLEVDPVKLDSRDVGESLPTVRSWRDRARAVAGIRHHQVHQDLSDLRFDLRASIHDSFFPFSKIK